MAEPRKRVTSRARGGSKPRIRARSASVNSRRTPAPDALSPGGTLEAIGAGGAEPLFERPTLAQLIVRGGVGAWSIVGVLILLAAFFYAARTIERVFPPLIVGAVMVLLLEPLVAWLVARGLRRGLAVSLVYLVVLAAVVGAGLVAIPAMVRQGQQFARDLPTLVESGGSLVASALRRLNQGETGRRLMDAVSSYLGTNAELLPRQVSRFASIGLRLADAAVTTFIGLFLGFYGLLALPKMKAAVTKAFPADRRAVVAPVLARVRGVFTEFLRARLIVSSAVGGIAILGLWLAGMPFWLLLGVIVGAANVVPILGSLIGGVPVLIVALLLKPPVYLLVVLVVLVVSHAVDGYLLSPIVMRETTELHPVVVLLAVLVGGAVLGVWGILAAVPVAGALQVLVGEAIRRHRLEQTTA